MNLEFSTINLIIIQISVGFTSIQGEKNQTACAHACSSIENIEQVGCTSFFKISPNFCLTLNSRVAQSIHRPQNKHCVFHPAVNPSAGLKSSPWERSPGWQCLFGLTVPLLGGKERATSSVSPLVVNCGVS